MCLVHLIDAKASKLRSQFDMHISRYAYIRGKADWKRDIEIAVVARFSIIRLEQDRVVDDERES